MAELVFFRRAEEMMRVGVAGPRLVVGRNLQCDVVVPDSTVSRLQFEVEARPEGWHLTDRSGRGTEVAGEILSECLLPDGADIGLGEWRAIFYLDSGASSSDGATLLPHSGRTAAQQPRPAACRARPARVRVAASGAERWVPFTEGMLVGSGESCAVRLDDPFVSGAHARLERRGDRFLVRDLQSTNGTFVGEVRVYEAEVPAGVPIRLGEAVLQLCLEEERAERRAFEGMVGGGPAMSRVYDTIERVAPSGAAVAVFGESGTGKELVARALHVRSPRAGRPFVPINCGALSRELIESELFGHEKGAFTGAERMHKGAFEEADGGTLFLDEIGELPLELQAKLLRALELGEVRRVGASRAVQVDVRLVAATNRDLRAQIRRGTFREDLYWRLCVVPIQLPPLRARREDLRELIGHFLDLHSPRGARVGLTAAAEARLLEHHWPGNVRELKNTLHRSLLLRRGERIDFADIAFEHELQAFGTASESGPGDPDADDLARIYIVDKTLERIEDEVFLKTCKRLGARASLLARALGQSRGAAYRRMEKLGITPSPAEPRD